MSTRHALLVDDSKSARFALRALLQRNGFEVATAESAEAAFEVVRQSQPDAIFMDHMMPGMDGYEATERLKKNPATSHIPIVMCTSNDQAEYVRKANATGALGILPKPATAEKLAEILEALDREIAGAAATTLPVEADRPAEFTTPGQDVELALRAALPSVIRDTVEPLIERKMLSQAQELRDEILAQSIKRSEETLEHSLHAASTSWRKTILNELRIESDARDATNQQRTAEQLDIIIRDLSGELKSELDGRFNRLTSRLLKDPAFRASIQTLAVDSAEDLAHRVATERASTAARESAEAIAVALSRRMASEFAPKFSALGRRINYVAVGAALIGVLSGLVGFLLATL